MSKAVSVTKILFLILLLINLTEGSWRRNFVRHFPSPPPPPPRQPPPPPAFNWRHFVPPTPAPPPPPPVFRPQPVFIRQQRFITQESHSHNQRMEQRWEGSCLVNYRCTQRTTCVTRVAFDPHEELKTGETKDEQWVGVFRWFKSNDCTVQLRYSRVGKGAIISGFVANCSGERLHVSTLDKNFKIDINTKPLLGDYKSKVWHIKQKGDVLLIHAFKNFKAGLDYDGKLSILNLNFFPLARFYQGLANKGRRDQNVVSKDDSLFIVYEPFKALIGKPTDKEVKVANEWCKVVPEKVRDQCAEDSALTGVNFAPIYQRELSKEDSAENFVLEAETLNCHTVNTGCHREGVVRCEDRRPFRDEVTHQISTRTEHRWEGNCLWNYACQTRQSCVTRVRFDPHQIGRKGKKDEQWIGVFRWFQNNKCSVQLRYSRLGRGSIITGVAAHCGSDKLEISTLSHRFSVKVNGKKLRGDFKDKNWHIAQKKYTVVVDAFRNFKVGVDFDRKTSTLNVNFFPLVDKYNGLSRRGKRIGNTIEEKDSFFKTYVKYEKLKPIPNPKCEEDSVELYLKI